MKKLVESLYRFLRERLKFSKNAKIRILKDQQNAKNPLGKTAYYDPKSFVITVFSSNRHPKDILRSLSHEIVHHWQNCEGRINSEASEGYFQKDQQLRELEREAYETGNMLFREWEEKEKKEPETMSLQDVFNKRNQKVAETLSKRWGLMKETEIDPEQLQKGTAIEAKEHKKTEEEARKIASQHLAEDPEYYTKLAKCGL